ncbi:MAG TPA: ABC transporter ATP-binding protein [Chthoniobacterales bacterium]|nr:ABC transporter ATP-binding protein [Chthoniobacterales bacterium]
MNNTIEIENLSHGYGREPVLHGLNLSVPAGSIYGFLGRNGAGKSTCIRILAGLSARREGIVRVLGEDPVDFSRTTLERLGYVAETSFLPSQMKVETLIAWTRKLYPRWSDEIVARLLERFRLDRLKVIHELSLGQQRQLAFLLAVAPRPTLLVLDEPAANLDTVARRGFLTEIAALAREEGTTVFFSTHVLGDVERVADRVGILSDGRLLIDEPLDDLKEEVHQVRFFWNHPEPPPVKVSGAYRTHVGRGEVLITMRVVTEASITELADRAGCQWETRSLNLEDLFVELTEGEFHD